MTLIASLLLIQAASVPVATPGAIDSNLEDKKIVCKTTIGTGSRLDTQRICLPKKEWRRMHDQGRETIGSLQDNQSKQVPNQ